MDSRWRKILLLCMGWCFFGVGLLMILMFFIVGLWEGFRQVDYILKFFATCAYVGITTWATFVCASRPQKYSGILLLACYLPLIIFIGFVNKDANKERRIVQEFLYSNDIEKSKAAEQQLEDYKQRAGTPPAVDELLKQLNVAQDDAMREKIIYALGKTSYQNKKVLDRLRELFVETKSDPAREALHEMIAKTILVINPYENMSKI